MPSSEESKFFIEHQLLPLGVEAKKMMGEYVLHLRGRILGFISDDMLLLEDVPTLQKLLPDAERTELFPGSKLFCIFPEVENSRYLCSICESIYEELPIPKPRKRKGQKAVKEVTQTEEDPIANFKSWQSSKKE